MKPTQLMAGPCHQHGRTQQALLMQVVLQMLALEHRVSVGPLDDMSMDLIEHIMEYSWNVHGIFMEYSWNIHGIFMEYSWNINGILMEYIMFPFAFKRET
jgi:hypothetical protein